MHVWFIFRFLHRANHPSPRSSEDMLVPSDPVGPEDREQPEKGYPLMVVAEQAENNTEVMAPLVWHCFVHPRTSMYEVKKQWGGAP